MQGGPHSVRRLLDELSEVRQDAATGGPVFQSGGGLVVVTGGGAALGTMLGRRSQFATVVLVALGGPVEAPGGIRVLAAAGALQAVRAWNDTIA